MPKKPCPDLVIEAGAELIKLHRMGDAYARQAAKAAAAVDKTRPQMIAAGARNMEYGEGMALLMDCQKVQFMSQMAHNSFRAILATCDYEEPSNACINAKIGGGITPLGGGGGGR